MARGRKKEDTSAEVTTPQGQWNAELVCDYFDKPTTLLERAELVQWIMNRGGFDAIDDYLRHQRLSKDDRQLLDIILDNPLESAEFYAEKIGTVRTTYYRRRMVLAEQLARYLNIWPSRSETYGHNGYTREVPSTSHIPATVSPFVGRKQDIDDAQSLLRDGAVRLISLTGPGGIGKTRLAIQIGVDAASQFNEGIWFVSLSTVVDPLLVPQAIAQTVGIREHPGQQAIQQLKIFLKERVALLILDNLEQVVSASSLIHDLLTSTNYLKIVATSRIPLRNPFEHEMVVQPLTLPNRYKIPSIKVLSRNPAVQLFVERGQSTKPDFMLTQKNAVSVVSICHKLEGLPLAIELAAARLRILSTDEILHRLDKRLKLLVGTASHLPARQQTMRNAIAWSYELLTPFEQRLFARLSVFMNGWTVAAAQAVCDDNEGEVADALEVLLNNNLIYQGEGVEETIRLGMLDTIREFAHEQLELMGELESCRNAHILYYAFLAETAEPELRGSQQIDWINRLDQDLDNLRTALKYSFESNQIPVGARIASALWHFWIYRGHTIEGYQWINQALLHSLELPLTQQVKALLVAGNLALNLTENQEALRLLEQCLDLADSIGDKHSSVKARSYLGTLAFLEGNYIRAKQLAEESLKEYRGMHDIRGIAFTLRDLAGLLKREGDYDQALRYYQESVDLYRTQTDKSSIAISLGLMGELIIQIRDFAEASTIFQEAYSLFEEIGDKWGKAWSLYNLGYTSIEQGIFSCEDILAQSLSLYLEIENIQGSAYCLVLLARIALEKNSQELAIRLLASSTKLAELADNMPLADRKLYEHLSGLVRSKLDPIENNTSWEIGYAMSLKDIGNYILER